MTCSFCGSRNNEDDRCRRCGRKPGDTLNGEFSMVRTEGALATKFELREQTAPVASADPAPQAKRPMARGVQQSLFPDRQSNLIHFEEYVPQKPAEARERASKGGAVKHRTPSRRHVDPGQGSLDLMPAQPAKNILNTTVEAVVSCDMPVATPPHRALAAVLDWSMALIGYGLLLTAYFLLGGQFTFDRLNLEVFGAALLLVGFTYGFMWALLGADSAGMRWMGLRLVTFDGYPLERKHRVWRFAGSCLSFGTVLGQLWSLWDEECLTWQDHISGTFPTPRGVQSQVFRRV